MSNEKKSNQVGLKDNFSGEKKLLNAPLSIKFVSGAQQVN